MIENVDHIIIAVEDLESAEENYTKIFGIEPVWRGFHNELGTSNVLFNFENTYLELLAATGSGIGADMVNNTIEKINRKRSTHNLNIYFFIFFISRRITQIPYNFLI